MLELNKKRGKTHLINLIGKRSNSTPNFALLVGAGASVSSGVKPTCRMISEWRQQLYEQTKSKEKFNKWLQKQDWWEDEEEYSILFEKVCDERSQRRVYIEECVKEAKPSWGYIYLANMIAHNYFNVIFTPNFDDLLNEACFTFADCRPIVCAHDSAVMNIRVISIRPKIIKLHGDFLYDSIKNTVRETEILEKNMRDKFIQFAREYGLIVIGYGGNDRSIMDILDTLLMSEGYLPNGLYWCTRREDRINKRVQRLMRREKAYWVEIEGYDEFMAEIHHGLGLTLPDPVRDPYKATTEKLNRFIEARKKTKHRVIKKDIRELEKHVKRFEAVVSGKLPTSEFSKLVPYHFLGDAEYEHHDYEKALFYYQSALPLNPSNLKLMERMVNSYNYTERFKEALQISERMIKRAPTHFKGYIYKGTSLIFLDKSEDAIRSYNKAFKNAIQINKAWVFTNRSNALLLAGKWKKAISDAAKAFQIEPSQYAAVINKCIALKKLNRKVEADKIMRDVLPKIKQRYLRACAFGTLGDKKNMLKELEPALKEDSQQYIVKARSDPDFMDFRKDSDFLKLLNKYKRKKRQVGLS